MVLHLEVLASAVQVVLLYHHRVYGLVHFHRLVLAGTLLLSLWLLPHTGYGATVMCVLVHTVLIRGKAVRLKVHQVVRSFSLLIYIPLYVELLVWLLPG